MNHQNGTNAVREDMQDDSRNAYNLIDYWQMVWPSRWFVLLVVMVSTAAGIYYARLQPDVYTAQTSLLTVSGLSGGLSVALSKKAPFGAAFFGGATPADQLKMLVQSRTIAENVLHHSGALPRMGLKEHDPLHLAIGVARLRKAASFESSNVGALKIYVTMADPDMAALLANAYSTALAEYLDVHSLNINFQVVDEAIVPIARSGPDRRLIIGLFCFLGCGGAVGMVLAYHTIRHMRKLIAQRAAGSAST